MDMFDDQMRLYRSLGLSEEAARVAAVGRNHRDEAEARSADLEFEAEVLAEDLIARTAGRTDTTSALADLNETVERLHAAIPTIAENITRQLRGQPLLPAPDTAPRVDVTGLSPVVAEAATVIRERLHASVGEARDMATRLHARETGRGGVAHADQFVRSFTQALRREVREVAPR